MHLVQQHVQPRHRLLRAPADGLVADGVDLGQRAGRRDARVGEGAEDAARAQLLHQRRREALERDDVVGVGHGLAVGKDHPLHGHHLGVLGHAQLGCLGPRGGATGAREALHAGLVAHLADGVADGAQLLQAGADAGAEVADERARAVPDVDQALRLQRAQRGPDRHP